MTTQLRRIRQNLGLNPKAITSGIQLPQIATREELDAIRDRGVAEMQRDGHSQNYLVWQEFCRRGIDEQLPSMRDLQGLATDEQSVYAETLQAAKSSRQVFDPARLDPRLEGVEINGTPIVELDQHEVLNYLHAGMAELGDEGDRGALMQMIEAVQNSPAGSLTNGVEINMPGPKLGYEVASEQESTGDWYTDQMNASMRAPQGLEDLAIGDGYGLDGYKGLGGGGGQYSPRHDMGLQQAIANGYFEGDDDGDDE